MPMSSKLNDDRRIDGKAGAESEMEIVVVGQTPPPFNGQNKMIEAMLAHLSEYADVRFVRMAYSDSISEVGKFSPKKIVRLFSYVFHTWKALGLRRERILYYPPASPNLIPVLRDIVFLYATRFLARGLVLHFHAAGVSSFAKDHPFLRPFMRLAYGEMDAAITIGDSSAEDGGYFRARRCFTVPNGMDVPVLAGVREEGRSVFSIIYLGIHAETKGLFDLLETASLLKDRNLVFEIKTVGEWHCPEERKRFEKLRKEHDLEKQVVELGFLNGDDLWRQYANADLFFFPTFYPCETQGIVLIEAMAYGLPAISTHWRGPEDVVVDGQTGFLCEIHDIGAFADVIERVARDGDLKMKLGVAGRRRYGQMYGAVSYKARLKHAFGAIWSGLS